MPMPTIRSTRAAGDTRRASITAGKTFDRGHITAAFEVRDDEGLTLGDRKDTSCPRELAFINGEEVGQTVPGGTAIRCFPFARNGGGIAIGIRLSPHGFQQAVPSRITYPGFDTGNLDIFGIRSALRLTQLNQRPESPPMLLDQTVFSPIRTYTGYVNGSYELGILGDAELYGEGAVHAPQIASGRRRPAVIPCTAPIRELRRSMAATYTTGVVYPIEALWLAGFAVLPGRPGPTRASITSIGLIIPNTDDRQQAAGRFLAGQWRPSR